MATALPLLKLSTLAVKAIAKPLAARMKVEASYRPKFKSLCEKIGEGVHYMYSRMNVVASGHKFVGVKPLSAEQALSDGISTLSETFVVAFSAMVIIVDYSRSNTSNALKAAKAADEKKAEKDALEARFNALELRLEALEKKLENKWFLSGADNKKEDDKDNSAKRPNGGWWLSGWLG